MEHRDTLLKIHDFDRDGDYPLTLSLGFLGFGRRVVSPSDKGWDVLRSGSESPWPDGDSIAAVVEHLLMPDRARSVLVATQPAPYKPQEAGQIPAGWKLWQKEKASWQFQIPDFRRDEFATYYDRVSHYEAWFFLIFGAMNPPAIPDPWELLARETVLWESLVLVENDFGQMFCLLCRSASDTQAQIRNLVADGLASSK